MSRMREGKSLQLRDILQRFLQLGNFANVKGLFSAMLIDFCVLFHAKTLKTHVRESLVAVILCGEKEAINSKRCYRLKQNFLNLKEFPATANGSMICFVRVKK